MGTTRLTCNVLDCTGDFSTLLPFVIGYRAVCGVDPGELLITPRPAEQLLRAAVRPPGQIKT